MRDVVMILTAILAISAAPAEPEASVRGPALDPSERVVLLPIQDRFGDPDAAAAIERGLVSGLGARHAIVPPGDVRDDLRRARIRDSGAIPTRDLENLARGIEVEAFLSVTLHHADRGAVPQIVLSGRLLRPGRPTLVWAGFEALSGLDGVRWLDRGRIEDLEALAELAVGRLIADLDGAAARRRHDIPPAEDAFAPAARPVSDLGTVALIPFDSAGGMTGASEIVTAAAMAVLHRRGAAIASPGNVLDVLKQRGVLLRGEIDPYVRAALAAGSGAEVLFTGTVEMLEVRPRGGGPEPLAALSARLVDAGSGRILWMAGADRSGWDDEGAFQWNRIHSIGGLAEGVIESLVASLEGPLPKRARRSRP